MGVKTWVDSTVSELGQWQAFVSMTL